MENKIKERIIYVVDRAKDIIIVCKLDKVKYAQIYDKTQIEKSIVTAERTLSLVEQKGKKVYDDVIKKKRFVKQNEFTHKKYPVVRLSLKEFKKLDKSIY